MLKTPADVSPNRHGYICAIVQVCLILSAIKLDRLVSSPAENLSPISRDVIITGAGLQPLRRFSAVTASREGSLPCPAYCDTWPRVLRSHSSDRGHLFASYDKKGALMTYSDMVLHVNLKKVNPLYG